MALEAVLVAPNYVSQETGAVWKTKVLVLHASPCHEGTNRSKLLGSKTN